MAIIVHVHSSILRIRLRIHHLLICIQAIVYLPERVRKKLLLELDHVKLISHGHILSLVLLVLAHVAHVVHRWVESANVW